MALRRDTVAKEAVHIALGITVEGTKEILGYSIAPNESAEIYKELLESVSLFFTDGLAGIKEVIEQTFPSAKIQRCLVHIARNIAAKVEEALLNLETFTSKWKRKYPRVIDILDKIKHLLTYFDYPKEYI